LVMGVEPFRHSMPKGGMAVSARLKVAMEPT
jgi:hypothetical protein